MANLKYTLFLKGNKYSCSVAILWVDNFLVILVSVSEHMLEIVSFNAKSCETYKFVLLASRVVSE